jgi:hypothetical protein
MIVIESTSQHWPSKNGNGYYDNQRGKQHKSNMSKLDLSKVSDQDYPDCPVALEIRQGSPVARAWVRLPFRPRSSR